MLRNLFIELSVNQNMRKKEMAIFIKFVWAFWIPDRPYDFYQTESYIPGARDCQILIDFYINMLIRIINRSLN